MPVAAYGVYMKVHQMVTLIGIGLGQGVQPIFGYYFGAKKFGRFIKTLRYSCIYGFLFCLGATVLCCLFINQIVGIFLTDLEALNYAVTFSKILLSTAWLFGIFYTTVNVLQGIGASRPSFWVSISRQGLIYIPMTFILNFLIVLYGLVWAQPIVDIVSLVLATILLFNTLKNFNIKLKFC